MKILTAEEIEAQRYHTLVGGVKGLALGFAISGLGFRYLPRRYPKVNFAKLSWSVKTAMFITPPTLFTVIMAEEASNKFDEVTYGTGKESSDYLEELKRWNELSTKEKMVESLSNHKYKIIVGAWAASLWGSWEIVNRDKIMTGAQKAVQARMYAQFITVALLLASIGLSAYENKLHPNQQQINEQKRWENVLKSAEEHERQAKEAKGQVTGFTSNEQRREAKIFKYD